MPDYRYVELFADDTMNAELGDLERIGVDTEFMRERTFFSQLCLVQIATETGIVCADPLGKEAASDGWSEPFWRAAMQPEWVVHSARQDIEVIYQSAGRMPAAVFDTQIAAAFLGYQPQLGYAGLVAELFSVELDKSHTRADWTKRPLSAAVLNYAAEDVLYLLPAYEELLQRLDKVGRQQWARQDSADLLDPALYETDPMLAINRLKGARNLRGRARAAALHLAAWREREALRANRPRQWIMRDHVLIEIAVSCPDNMSAMAAIDGIAEGTVRRAGDELLGILKDATHDESGYQPPTRPDEQQKSALKHMQKQVSKCADELGIAAELLAPKKELSAAMLGNRQSRVFNGWRRDIIGERLLETLESL